MANMFKKAMLKKALHDAYSKIANDKYGSWQIPMTIIPLTTGIVVMICSVISTSNVFFGAISLVLSALLSEILFLLFVYAMLLLNVIIREFLDLD